MWNHRTICDFSIFREPKSIVDTKTSRMSILAFLMVAFLYSFCIGCEVNFDIQTNWIRWTFQCTHSDIQCTHIDIFVALIEVFAHILGLWKASNANQLQCDCNVYRYPHETEPYVLYVHQVYISQMQHCVLFVTWL